MKARNSDVAVPYSTRDDAPDIVEGSDGVEESDYTARQPTDINPLLNHNNGPQTYNCYGIYQRE